MPMFHVEHMKNLFLSLFLALFCFSACTKADSEAYRRDPILLDYVSQQAATNSQLEALNKQIDGSKKEMRNSVPQSGQYNANRKKLNEQQAQADKLLQQLQFWKLKIESRAKEAQLEYLESHKNKTDWPDKNKIDSYFAEKRLRQAKMQWDQKDRIEKYKKGTPAQAPTSQDK